MNIILKPEHYIFVERITTNIEVTSKKIESQNLIRISDNEAKWYDSHSSVFCYMTYYDINEYLINFILESTLNYDVILRLETINKSSSNIFLISRDTPCCIVKHDTANILKKVLTIL